jgi:hypothetical protein
MAQRRRGAIGRGDFRRRRSGAAGATFSARAGLQQVARRDVAAVHDHSQAARRIDTARGRFDPDVEPLPGSNHCAVGRHDPDAGLGVGSAAAGTDHEHGEQGGLRHTSHDGNDSARLVVCTHRGLLTAGSIPNFQLPTPKASGLEGSV